MIYTCQYPPLDVDITLLGLIDFHARNNPDLPWAVFPSPAKNASSISFAELAKASHRIAQYVTSRRDDRAREVVAMLVHCDTVLYISILVGIIRAGLVVCARLSTRIP